MNGEPDGKITCPQLGTRRTMIDIGVVPRSSSLTPVRNTMVVRRVLPLSQVVVMVVVLSCLWCCCCFCAHDGLAEAAPQLRPYRTHCWRPYQCLTILSLNIMNSCTLIFNKKFRYVLGQSGTFLLVPYLADGLLHRTCANKRGSTDHCRYNGIIQ